MLNKQSYTDATGDLNSYIFGRSIMTSGEGSPFDSNIFLTLKHEAMNKLIIIGLALIVFFTLILEPQIDYKLKHSLVPLFLGAVLLFPNKTTWKLGLLVCCWGVINLILRDQYAAEPTVFHFGYWMTKYSFNTPNTFFDLIFLWWFPMYVYAGIIFSLTRRKEGKEYLFYS